MVLPPNTFGLLGDKSRRAEAVNAYFQKMEETRRFGGETTDDSSRVIHQIFLPTNLSGTFVFEVCVVGHNVSTGALYESVAGYVTATVNGAGDVTVLSTVASSNLGLRRTNDGTTASLNINALAQDATPTLPPCVNIRVTGLPGAVIQWSGMVRMMAYSVANRHQTPVGSELGTDAPAIT